MTGSRAKKHIKNIILLAIAFALPALNPGFADITFKTCSQWADNWQELPRFHQMVLERSGYDSNEFNSYDERVKARFQYQLEGICEARSRALIFDIEKLLEKIHIASQDPAPNLQTLADLSHELNDHMSDPFFEAFPKEYQAQLRDLYEALFDTAKKGGYDPRNETAPRTRRAKDIPMLSDYEPLGSVAEVT
ncbi:hypothetical protein ACFL6Y_06400 [Elusimicrobiota bacterium]